MRDDRNIGESRITTSHALTLEGTGHAPDRPIAADEVVSLSGNPSFVTRPVRVVAMPKPQMLIAA